MPCVPPPRSSSWRRRCMRRRARRSSRWREEGRREHETEGWWAGQPPMKSELTRSVADPSLGIPASTRSSRGISRVRRLCLSMLISIVPAGNLRAQETPPSPSRPWSPPGLAVYERDLAAWPSTEAKIDPDKVYDLPELIDIAESTNPQTRVAWERARQAAAAVGLSESAYCPYLAASAFAGYEKAFI